jgi:hypothetical protein
MTTVQFTPAAKADRIYSAMAGLKSGALLTVASTDACTQYLRLTLEEAHALAHELLKCIDAVEAGQ